MGHDSIGKSLVDISLYQQWSRLAELWQGGGGVGPGRTGAGRGGRPAEARLIGPSVKDPGLRDSGRGTQGAIGS